MQEIWVVSMNANGEDYNVYFSEERAKRAVSLMRDRLGKDADIINPHVVGRFAEGEAFGNDVSVSREYDDVFLPTDAKLCDV